jgi:hypothetical protein
MTPPYSKPGLRPLRNQQFCRLDAQITCDLRWQWQSRLVVSTFSGSQDPYPAYAAVQQLSFRLLDQLRSTLQFVVFDVKDWSNRIYLYEPGPYYSFNFPSHYGTGQKTILVLTLQIFQKISLAAKAACTSYQHRKFLGSGNDLIPGNKKWSLEMQVRLTY